MQSNKNGPLAGILVFVGIIGIGAVSFYFVRLYSSMPSRNDVINFTNNLMNEVPAVSETIEGSLVPDGGGQPNTNTTTDFSDSSLSGEESTESDWLTPGQRQVLSTLGIDESNLPKKLTPELEACFVLKIGEERVSAIKNGDTPTLVEGMKAMTCLDN